MTKTGIDDIDRNLLRAIQRDASLTTDALAGLVGASPSAVQRRLARLKKEGVLVGQVAVIRANLVGQSQTFVVGVEIERKRVDLYAAFRQWLDRTEEVQQAYNVTGASDFILIVTAASIEQYDALMEEMLKENPNVKKFVTSAVLQTYKRSLFTPVQHGV
ncbi:MAG: Lrp/AsnC family transcriptional regulator [Alphaproteobacteria bacterium]|nr:Lrp/AsnC family transcriptional regulator [Alphaproteobacteria bacterium]